MSITVMYNRKLFTQKRSSEKVFFDLEGGNLIIWSTEYQFQLPGKVFPAEQNHIFV